MNASVTITVQQGKQNNYTSERGRIHAQHYAEWEHEERLSAN